MPAFMSNAPGPRATPSSTVNGNSASVPRGHTVSKWHRTRTGRPPGRRHARCAAAGSGSEPSRSRQRSSITSAQAATPSASPENDSVSTSLRS
jgi:hypothetical protein